LASKKEEIQNETHSGSDRTIIDQVEKQLYKLINVTKVTDVTGEPAVIRELALIKVTANAATRSEITSLVDIFRATVVDVSPDSLTIQITGTEDKVDSLTSLLRPFGIRELARTGRLAMVRGNNGHTTKSANSKGI